MTAAERPSGICGAPAVLCDIAIRHRSIPHRSIPHRSIPDLGSGFLPATTFVVDNLEIQ